MTTETPNPTDSATVLASVADTPAASASPSGVGDAPAAVPSAEGKTPSADLDAAKAAAAAPSFLNQTGEEKPEAKAEGDKKDAAVAPAEPAKKEGDAVAPAAEATAPAVEPVAYEYKLPETLTINDEQRTEFNSILDSFRADPVKGTQGLVDLHARLVNDAVQGAAKQLELRQYTTFNETRMDWRNQMAADEEIGGSAIKTSRTNALAVINRFVDEKHRPGLESMLYVTGVGDHPEFVRILNRIGKFMREPGLPPANFNPVPDGGKNPGLSREQRLYGKA